VENTRFDVFLSHARLDELEVEKLARLLMLKEIRPWFDKWELIPGEPWQEAIEKALESCPACAVCIGANGVDGWQTEQMNAAIQRQVSKKQSRVIPILLPGAERGERSSLPLFLEGRAWVDFYGPLEDEQTLHRLIAGIRGEAPGPGPEEAVASGVCPYRGLEYFDVEHSRFFHGRSVLTGWLLAKLRPTRFANRFLAIVGPSGSGKSSLARAGLLGSLKNGAIPGSQDWPRVICKPGSNPLESLAVELTRVLRLGDSSENLVESFGTNPRKLHLTVREALSNAPEEHRLVLLVDQFEEVFTLCTDEIQRQALINNLLLAAKEVDGRTAVVLTLRADFYGHCTAYPELADAVSDRTALVGAMTEKELRQAIEEPARPAGLQLDGGLPKLLVGEILGKAGALPSLEHALLQLWNRREGLRLTAAAYDEIGGVAGALQHHAQDVFFKKLSIAEQGACRRIFLCLVQVDEQSGATKLRLGHDELISSAQSRGDWQVVETVVSKLTDERLLTAEGEEKRATIELAHEALLTAWDQLKQWIEDNRKALQTRHRLDTAVTEWRRSGRDPSYLYRGSLLALAEEWAARHPGEVIPGRKEFIEASIAQQNEELQHELTQARDLEEEKRHRAEERAQANQRIAQEQRQRAEEGERANKKLKQHAIAFAMAAVVAVIAALAVWYLLGESEKGRRIRLASNLASQSATAMKTDPSLGLLLSIEAMRLADKGGQPDLPAAEEALRQTLSPFRGNPLPTGKIKTMSISDDGTWLAMVGSNGTLSTWNLTDGGPIPRLSLPASSAISSAERIAMGPEGRWLLAGYENHSSLFDLNTKNASVTVDLENEDWLENSDPFSPDGRWLLTRQDLDSCVLRAVNNPARPKVATLRIRPKAVAFSRNRQWLAVAESGTLQLWGLSDLSERQKIQTPDIAEPETLTFSSNSQWLVMEGKSSANRTVQAWRIDPAQGLVGSPLRLDGCAWSAPAAPDARDPVLLSRIPSLSRCLDALRSGGISIWMNQSTVPVTAAVLDPEGKRYALGHADGSVSLSNLEAGSISPLKFKSQAGPIQRLVLYGRWLITQGGKDAPRVFEVLPGPRVDIATVEPILTAAGPGVAAVSSNGWRLSIDPASREARLRGPQGSRPVSGSESTSPPWVFSPDGRWLAAVSDGRPLVWRVQEDGMTSTPISFPVQFHHSSPVSVLVFSPDGHWLATGDEGEEKAAARLWSPQAPKAEPRALTNSRGGVKALAFSLDSRLIATAAGNGNVRLRELKADGPALADQPEAPENSGGIVTALAFLPDGRLALGRRERVLLWKPGQPDVVLHNNAEAILRLAASPRGDRLASSSANKGIQIWSLDGKSPQSIPVKLSITGSQITTTRDGNGLWTVDPAGRLRRWELRIDKLLKTACKAAGRNLTPGEWKTYLLFETYQETETCPAFPEAFD
jgi:WD40 repeat protein